MARRIVVTSGKGGVGKTTFVSFLGVELSRMGCKVLLIDMDFGLNNLDVLMGVENKIVYDVIDVIEGRCSPKQALIEDFYESNLYILPSTHGFCSKKFGSKELLEIILQLENDFDVVNRWYSHLFSHKKANGTHPIVTHRLRRYIDELPPFGNR
jgi:septum site-determining protein MinD